jgi:hypothetical protein
MQAIVLFYKLGGDFPGPNQDSRIGALTITHTQELQLADFVQNALIDPRVAAQVYPFDRPTLNSEQPGNFPSAYGFGSSGSGSVVPAILAPHSSFLGNHTFTIGIVHGLGGAPAALAVSAAQASSTFGSNPLWINPNFVFGQWPFVLAGQAGSAGAGYTSLVTDIGYNPAIGGVTAYIQAAVADASAPAGLAVTAGLQVTLVDFGP